MPANRSRTMEWRRCLRQVCERKGALEIAVVREYDEGENGQHLVWRVRVLNVTDGEIVVEEPMTLGRVIHLEPGIELVVILVIGQNRWMFRTTILTAPDRSRRDRRGASTLRLAMPKSVERCQRRNYYRFETTGISLPSVDVWPLLDPKSVLIAERSYELQFEQAERPGGGGGRSETAWDSDAMMPDVGPRFTAILLNVGGGGMGLRVSPEDAQALVSHKLFWIRFQLSPELTTPICATTKLVHTHIDSTQHTYAGMAFDFSFNPVHQRMVVEQICRFIERQQHDQLKKMGAGAKRRKSA